MIDLLVINILKNLLFNSSVSNHVKLYKMKLKVYQLHHIAAFGLTVCLATCCKLMAADQQQILSINNSTSNKWIPLTNSSSLVEKSSDKMSANKELDRGSRRECLFDEVKTTDNLDVAASVMAPIERMPRRQEIPMDDEQEDQQEDESDEESPSAFRRAEGPQDHLDQHSSTNEIAEPQQKGSSSNNNNADRGEEVDPVAAEQEAAEANEAEQADRSALDEQLQQQREIIMAQAQSEAKAIREQQEALLRQQNLQQQMQLRHQINRLQEAPQRNKLAHYKPTATNQRHIITTTDSAGQAAATSPSASAGKTLPIGATRMFHRPAINHQKQKQQQQQQVDIQFSDQPDGKNDAALFSPSSMNQQQQQAVLLSAAATANGYRDASEAKTASLKLDGIDGLMDDIESTTTTNPFALNTNINSGGDLHTAAQHHYGSHYGSVKGHHGDYYQFAESHKKGQFHSGFKRGGKKFQVSGHASQHKSHAEGHVNWHGKKGKGVQYWDYKHKNNKHHGYHH